MTIREQLLFNKHYVESDIKAVDINYPYYALRIMSFYGVNITNPERLNGEVFQTLDKFFGRKIPKSFYANPQDTKYLSSDELLIEQLVSYFKIEFVTGVDSENREDFERVEVFKKAFPDYVEGNELKLRNFTIIDRREADNILREVADVYASYTRPWGIDEFEIFQYLYQNAYYVDAPLACKDNIISCLKTIGAPRFAKMLDQKDVVKLSIDLFGECSTLNIKSDRTSFNLLTMAVLNCYPCPLSKKQAKYFNTLCKQLVIKHKKETNARSPYKAAKALIDAGKTIEAAEVFAKNGSLLQRNLVWLLSRAKDSEVYNILDMVKADNPIVLAQLLLGLTRDTYENPRSFKFYAKNRAKSHVETDHEFKYRKSKLTEKKRQLLTAYISDKIDESYKAMESIGKVYIDEEFKKVAVPFNTTASGKGLDVPPVGTRLPIKSDYIRTFCYWKDVYDIDASAVMLRDLDCKTVSSQDILYWGNYYAKNFGNSALCSGDDRSNKGAEYQDFKLSELREKGFKYVIYSLNGFGGPFANAEVYCGYQCKNNLNTQAWSAKNIETQIQVKGDSRYFIGFAIDLTTNEMIILNTVSESDARVINAESIQGFKDYLDSKFLETFNMYRILSMRGEVVENPEDADIIFTSSTKVLPTENQRLIRPFDIEDLVSFINSDKNPKAD